MPTTDGIIQENSHTACYFRASSHFSAFLTVTTSACMRMLFFISAYRSDNFIIGLTDVSPATTTPTLWNYDVCAQYPGAVGYGATVYLPCTSCMPPRRYLISQVERTNNIFNFCEIEVYVSGKLIFVLSYKQSYKST